MSRHPFDSDELGRIDPDLDHVGGHLERYASELDGEPPVDLASSIRAAIEDQPLPTVGWWTRLSATTSAWHRPARLVLASGVVAMAVIGALALGQLADRARNIGSSPAPSVIVSPTPTPTPTPSVSPTPTFSAAPSPTGSDDDDDVETPEPSESEDDNSGPGGGDNSGRGGGDD